MNFLYLQIMTSREASTFETKTFIMVLAYHQSSTWWRTAVRHHCSCAIEGLTGIGLERCANHNFYKRWPLSICKMERRHKSGVTDYRRTYSFE